MRSDHCWSQGRGRPRASFHAGSWIARARESRASVTAEALAKPRDLPIVKRVELREKSDGVWQGHTHAEVQVIYEDLYPHYLSRKPDFAAPEGETLIAFRDRIAAALTRINKSAHAHACEMSRAMRGKCSTMCTPVRLVALGLKLPRNSSGASGFRSKVSSWLGAP